MEGRRGFCRGENVQGRPIMVPAANPPRATDQTSSCSRRFIDVRDTKQYAVGAAAMGKALKLADHSIKPPSPKSNSSMERGGEGSIVRRKQRTGETNDGSAAGEDAKGADVPPGHGIADGGNEETAAKGDNGRLGGLADDIVGLIGLVDLLKVSHGAQAVVALHDAGHSRDWGFAIGRGYLRVMG